jgi:hypothetical protein
VGNDLFCEAVVTEVRPQWSDSRKLILDRYVTFHEIVEFKAERPPRYGEAKVSRAYANREIGAIVRDVINACEGDLHYTIDHDAYPDGAEHEYQKFLDRKSAENELEVGGISSGQWVGSDRMDLTGAYAKDGDTISGIKVDGNDWPDVRFMMVDCEETSLNSHAKKRHPETEDWTSEQYDASGYKLKADAATATLQNLIDTRGIDYIELNPHKDSTGAFDDRVDYYGRYIGMVYGGGQCFNAALVELGHSDVYLYADGAYHDPEMALKDFYSYSCVCTNSIEPTGVTLSSFDVNGGAFEALTTLAYAASGFVWSLDANRCVRFRAMERTDRVVFFDPVELGLALGARSSDLVNAVYFDGNPIAGAVSKTYSRPSSVDEFDWLGRGLNHFGISREEDADKLAEGLLNDVAFPDPVGEVVWFHGDADASVGDVIEFRDGPLRRLTRELPDEWGGRFQNMHVGRVREVRHRLSGKQVSTRAWLTSPLRSVDNPMGFMVRSQPKEESLFQFRLDDVQVALDVGYHLD